MFSMSSVPESASLSLVLCLLNAFVSDGSGDVGAGNDCAGTGSGGVSS